MTAVIAADAFVEPGWGAVADAFRTNFEDGKVGAACSVWRDGRPVVDLWGGLADPAGRPWASDTIVIIFSCTKGVTAICANRLIEEGRLDPDALVAAYWPEFAAHGKDRITVRQALSHRAGLAALDADLTMDDLAAWDPVVAAIAAQAPSWEPGSAHGYHSRTFGWIVGELIRRVTGLMPGTYLAEQLARPLGLELYLGVPDAVDPRVASLIPAANAAALDDFAASQPESLFARVMTGPSNLLHYDEAWNGRLLRAAQLPSSKLARKASATAPQPGSTVASAAITAVTRRVASAPRRPPRRRARRARPRSAGRRGARRPDRST